VFSALTFRVLLVKNWVHPFGRQYGLIKITKFADVANLVELGKV
jgi:hypothetical protein